MTCAKSVKQRSADIQGKNHFSSCLIVDIHERKVWHSPTFIIRFSFIWTALIIKVPVS